MLDELAQTPFEIVHTRVFVPVSNVVTCDVFSVGVVTIPVPAITVHTPVPTSGLLAFNVKVEAHKFCDTPALAAVGRASTIIAIVELEAVQGRFEIVHAKTLVPKPNPVIVVLGNVGFVIIPVPETNVHKPVPTVGVFAVIIVVDVVIQSVWVGPALDTVGISFTNKVTVEIDDKHGGFEMVHENIFGPKPKPVILVLGNVGFEIVPLPETKVHKPVPVEGVLPFMLVFGDEIQSV